MASRSAELPSLMYTILIIAIIITITNIPIDMVDIIIIITMIITITIVIEDACGGSSPPPSHILQAIMV